ncbi:2-hydroxycarboxylate transporter family protein, partial [Bacillus sp. HC-Mk]
IQLQSPIQLDTSSSLSLQENLMQMYPVESAIVTGCHSGLGGTGDVAILSASNRMELMPFAQISTRLGGAAMVVTATILLKMFS